MSVSPAAAAAIAAPAANAAKSLTAIVIDEFVEQIDLEKEYDIKELKQILGDIYKTKTAKPVVKKETKAKKTDTKPVAAAAAVASDDTDSDDDKPKKRGRPAKGPKLDKNGNEKAKREPSAYNKFVKQRISELKTEKPDTAAKDLMMLAAAEWKNLSDDDKKKYQ